MQKLLIASCAGMFFFSSCKPTQKSSDELAAMPLDGTGDSIQLVTMPTDQGAPQLCAYLAKGAHKTTHFIDTEVPPMLEYGVPSYQVVANLRNRKKLITNVSVNSESSETDLQGSLSDAKVAMVFGDVMNELNSEEIGGMRRSGKDPLTSQINVRVDPAAISLLKQIISDAKKPNSQRFVAVKCGTSKTQIATNHLSREAKSADIKERRNLNCHKRLAPSDALYSLLAQENLIPSNLKEFCINFANQRDANLYQFAANEMCRSRGQGVAVAMETGYECKSATR